MTLCPIAIAVGCMKCPVFGLCPVKGVIGNYRKADDAKSSSGAPKAKNSGKRRG
jgi:hypothetical protein